jgi:hypothetical protein
MRPSTARVISAGIGMASHSVHGSSFRGVLVSFEASLRSDAVPSEADDVLLAEAHATAPVRAEMEMSRSA